MALPPWTTINTHLTLFHGCVESASKKIAAGVVVRVGSPRVDFGNGFYTTTIRDQARDWARKVYLKKYPAGNPADPPVVVKFVVPLVGLADLSSLAFVRGDATNAVFWSFVTHCRGGNSHAHPVRIPPDDWYDMVVGPVASWPPRAGRPLYCLGSFSGAVWHAFDQFTFHTAGAVKVLNGCDRTDPDEFEIVTLAP